MTLSCFQVRVSEADGTPSMLCSYVSTLPRRVQLFSCITFFPLSEMQEALLDGSSKILFLSCWHLYETLLYEIDWRWWWCTDDQFRDNIDRFHFYPESFRERLTVSSKTPIVFAKSHSFKGYHNRFLEIFDHLKETFNRFFEKLDRFNKTPRPFAQNSTSFSRQPKL